MSAGSAVVAASVPPARGGDRLYAVARGLLLVVLFVMVALLHGFTLWSPHQVFAQLFWAYVGFALLAGACTLLPRCGRVLPWGYACDILWLAALAFVGPGLASSFTALFVLPLVAAALRLPRVNVLVLSILAVILTIVLGYGQSTVEGMLASLSQSLVFGVLPWLVNLLSEQWSADNRQRVAVADQQAMEALVEARTYHDRMRALYEVALSLNSATDPHSVLSATLNECARILPYTSGAILMPTGSPGEVQVIAGRNLQAIELTTSFTVGSGTLGMILQGGTGGVLNNAQHEPELASLPSISAHPNVLILPLRSAKRTFGLVLFGSDAEQLTVEQMDMATTLVSYGLVVLQNVQLIAELREERSHLLSREEEVRKQLNRDLHDGPAQALAAITMTLGFIKRLYEKEPERVIPELDKLAAMAQRANHEVRTLLFELRPLVLETQGLVPTLQQYLERFASIQTPRIMLEGDDTIAPLTKRVQGTLFNIVQESINNAIKHAQAQHIWIRLAATGDELSLTIQDDGKGFDLQAVKASYAKRGSFGLLSLEERARLVGGSAELLSAPGAGTTVRVVVPIEG